MAIKHIDEFPGMSRVCGDLDGLKVFRTMLDAGKEDGKDNTWEILKILNETVKKFNKSAEGSREQVAAFNLMRLVSKSLVFYARTDDYRAWIDAEQHQAEENWQLIMNLRVTEKAEQAQKDKRFQSFLAQVTG